MNEQTKPYHETVVSLIATINSVEDAMRIAIFIRCTTLPANHDAVIAAWRQLLQRLGLQEDITGVISFVTAAKISAENAKAGNELLYCVAGC